MKTISLLFTVWLVFVTITLGGENPWRLSAKRATSPTLGWTRSAIEGFALPTSVKPGETIKFYVSLFESEGQSFTMEIYRIPKIDSSLITPSTHTGAFYPLHDANGSVINLGDYSRKAVDFKKGCKQYWEPTAISLTIQSDWKSGLYCAKLISASQKDYYVPFIVRAPVAGSTSNILFKFDFNTLHAYNWWGGGSLYSSAQDDTSGSSLTISNTIAIDRPMQFGDNFRYYATTFIRTMEDSGMVIEYCNNIDVDSLGLTFLSNYKTLILWCHDEYWTQHERDYTENFIGRNNPDMHNNLARFAPNTCYWQIRWLNGAHLQLVCDKWREDTSYTFTTQSQFRLLTPTNPEGKFLGSQYQHGWNMISADDSTDEPADSVVAAEHWIFRGTGLVNGDTLGVLS